MLRLPLILLLTLSAIAADKTAALDALLTRYPSF